MPASEVATLRAQCEDAEARLEAVGTLLNPGGFPFENQLNPF